MLFVIGLYLLLGSAPPQQISFHMEQHSGDRPILHGILDGRAIDFCVHSNFGSYVQINHAEAAHHRFRDVKHVASYGIVHPGQLSSLGRDEALANTLRVGSESTNDVPISIFEVPKGSTEGMLGVKWIAANRIVMDFRHRQLWIKPSRQELSKLNLHLLKQRYRAIPLQQDPTDGRYLVSADLQGVTRQLVLSTVAETQLDTDFVRAAHIPLGAPIAQYGGPSGVTGQIFETATPVSLQLSGWTSQPVKTSVFDTYAYMHNERPKAQGAVRGGQIGASMLLRSGAVVDFGSLILYLPEHN